MIFPAARKRPARVPHTLARPCPCRKTRGLRLGDLVARLADPIKRLLVRLGPPWLARRLHQCKCRTRRAALNRL